MRGQCGGVRGLSSGVLVLDVSNILHTTGVLPADLAGPDLPGLLRLMALSRYAKRECVAVCDGRPPSPRKKAAAAVAAVGVAVHYSYEEEADAVLERLIAQTPRSKRATVVSSDRRVAAAAKRAGMTSLTSEAFLAKIAADVRRRHAEPERPKVPHPRESVPLPAGLVGEWAAAFGVHGAEAVAELQALAERLTVQYAVEDAAKVVGSGPERVGERKKKAKGGGRGGKVAGEAKGGGANAPKVAAEQAAARQAAVEALRRLSPEIDLSDLDMERWLTAFPNVATERTEPGARGGPGGRGRRGR